MKNNEINRRLRKLPAVHELAEELRSEIPDAAPAAVREACRNTLETERKRILDGGDPMSLDELKKDSVSELRCLACFSMKNVINATGVILHTAIGRACLPDKSIEAVYRVAKGYSVLQWDEETGRRGHQCFSYASHSLTNNYLEVVCILR